MLYGFDTETYLIRPREKAPKPVCCTWACEGRNFLTRPGDQETFDILSNPGNMFVGQNIPYDIIVMMRWHPDLIPHLIRALDEGRVWDTAMRERMTYLATEGGKGYDMFPSMEDLASKYLGLDLSKEKEGLDIWRLKYGTLDGIPFDQWPSAARKYALDDAQHTLDIFIRQGGVEHRHPTEELQVASSVVLQAIGAWGFKVNQEKRNKIKDALEAQQKPLLAKIPTDWFGKGSQTVMAKEVLKAWHQRHLGMLATFGSVTGVQLNVEQWKAAIHPETSIPAVLVQCIDKCCLPPGMSAPPGTDIVSWAKEALKVLPEIPMTTRGPSTSEESLTALFDATPMFQAFGELKHIEKMLENYVYPYKHETAHPSFVPMVSTGRTGCRGDKDKLTEDSSCANLQNVPRKDKKKPDEAFRTMYEARKGYILGTVDYSQLELCTLAATIRVMFPNQPCALGDAIDNGMDVHCITGGLISGISYENMLAGKKSDEQIGKYRQGAKAANFGLPGGLGGPAFVGYARNNYGVEIGIQQAYKFINAWKIAWPEIPNLYLKHSHTVCDAGEGGKATGETISGRKKAKCFYTEISNFRFQALAADGAKAALWSVWREATLGWYWSRKSTTGYCSDHKDTPLRDSHLVNFVHDELVAEHPATALGEDALHRQEALMIAAMGVMCQHKIKISVEGKLSEAWEH